MLGSLIIGGNLGRGLEERAESTCVANDVDEEGALEDRSMSSCVPKGPLMEVGSVNEAGRCLVGVEIPSPAVASFFFCDLDNVRVAWAGGSVESFRTASYPFEMSTCFFAQSLKDFFCGIPSSNARGEISSSVSSLEAPLDPPECAPASDSESLAESELLKLVSLSLTSYLVLGVIFQR
jgi:hypothetical protein